MPKPTRCILGVDPGSLVTGYAVLNDIDGKLFCSASGIIRLAPPGGKCVEVTLATRLGTLYQTLSGLIEKHKPRELAVESVFHARNAMSALKLGHARGVVLLCASVHNMTVAEYAPRAIKRGITGSGAAGKDQVDKMVRLLVKGDVAKELDATDALAAAIFHSYHNPELMRPQPGKQRGTVHI